MKLTFSASRRFASDQHQTSIIARHRHQSPPMAAQLFDCETCYHHEVKSPSTVTRCLERLGSFRKRVHSVESCGADAECCPYQTDRGLGRHCLLDSAPSRESSHPAGEQRKHRRWFSARSQAQTAVDSTRKYDHLDGDLQPPRNVDRRRVCHV